MATATEHKPRFLPKNASEHLRVARSIYEGQTLLDVRVWTEWEPQEASRPTKKGLALRPGTWRELLPLIEELLGEMVAGSPSD